MSMRGSPINWWKEKRQSSHTGIPHANRPQTAFPWNEDRDISKIVEQAVLAAFESNAFRIAVASQVDPAFSRHQEKLNQIKTTNLNLESTLQAHVEDLPGVLKGIEDQLTRIVIPDYRHSLDTLALGQERLDGKVNDIHIPDHSNELSEIVSGQARFLKTFENRLSALESRLEDLDRKTGDVDEAVVNADLRSAIRFGEISNELQDRNTTLNNSIWEVQRELGKKTDALQRRVVGACEDMGKSIRASAETIETMRAKLDEDDVLAAVNKVNSRAEFSEKALRRSITAIQDKVSGLDTSAIPVQIAKLETIERGISDFKKEAEAARNLASVSSKFLSANTTKLDSMASAVGKMHLLVESTNEICQEVSESQEANAGSIKEDVEAVRMHVRSLDNLAVSHARKLSDATSILTRTEGAVVAFDTAVIGRLGDLASSAENIEEKLRPLSSHSTKLDGLESSLTALVKDSKPQKAALDDLTKTLSEMRSNVDTALASHTDSLGTIHQTVSNTASKDGLSTALSNLQTSIEKKITSSHETASQTTVEAITNHVSSLDSKLQNGLQSIKDDTYSRTKELQTPISEILEEVRSSKALIDSDKAEMREEFNNTRTAIEASRAERGVDALSIKRLIQDLQEAGRDEEILLQVESWGQNCITKQAAEVASLRDLLESSRVRDETLQKSVDGLNERSTEISTFLHSGELESASTVRELSALRTMLETSSNTTAQTSQTLTTIQQDVQALTSDSTLNTIKHLAQQNASSLATAYEGILSLDTKLATNSETVHATLQDLQTALGRDILDATTSITTSMHDDADELKTDLSSRISTGTNVLRAEIKAIDLTSTVAAVETLKNEVEMAGNKHVGVAESLKASIEGKIEELGRDVKDFRDTHRKELQVHGAALDGLRDISTNSTSALSSDLEKLRDTVGPIPRLVDGVSAMAAVVKDVDLASKSNATTLESIGKSLTAATKQTDTRLTELKNFVGAEGEKTLQAVQTSHAVLTNLQESTTEEFAKTRSGIESVDSALLNVTAASKESEKVILASAAGIATEILIVKSDIGGIATSMTHAAEHAAKAEDVHAQVLTAVQSQLKESERVEEGLKRVEDSVVARIREVNDALERTSLASKELHGATISALTTELHVIQEALASESKKTNEFVASSSDAVKGTISAEFTSTKESLLGELHGIEAAILDSKNELAEIARLNGRNIDGIAEQSEKRQEKTLAALQAESKNLLQALVAESEKTNTALATSLSSTQQALFSEITGTKDALSAKNDDLTSRLQELNNALAKAITESIASHSKTLSTLQADFNTLQEVLVTEIQGSKTTLQKDLAVVKSDNQEGREAITGLVKEGNSRFDDAAADARNMCKEVIASIEGQSQKTLDTMRTELKDVTTAVDAAREVTVVEVGKARDGIEERMGAVEKTISDGVEGAKKDIEEEVGKARKEVGDGVEKLLNDINAGSLTATETHEATLTSIKAESKLLSGLILSESKSTNAGISAAKDLTISELQRSKTSLDERLNSVETSISTKFSETNGIFKQELDHVASKADKIHDATLEAIKLTSKTCITGVDSAELRLKDTIKELSSGSDKHHEATLEAIKLTSKTCLTGLDSTELHIKESIKQLSDDVDSASQKETLSHTTTLDAITLIGTTLTSHITSEISTSTNTHNTSSQSILNSLSKAQSTLDTLQTTTTTLSAETAAHFSSAASARKKSEKKVEANTDTILEAIRQQGKTTSSSVDAVQKVVLTGVQNLNSSLEGYIERSLEKSSADLVDVVRSTLEDIKNQNSEASKALDGKMDGVIEAVKEEAAMTRNSTAAIENNTANLSSQVSKGFSDLSTESKATSTALDAHVSTLSAAIKDEAETTQARIETLHTRIFSELQKTDTALRSSLNTLKSDLTNLHSTTDKLSTTLSQTSTKLSALPPTLGAIDAAVRVNSAAIARVDKAVLESSSQVKSEINSCVSSLSSQLDDEISEIGRRVRGIAEFEIPRLEVLMRRQRDAVEVIGGRVIGTTKRFDEMVAGVGKGAGNGGLGGSEILGMGGRLRGGSNASSTRSKDSGYRMGAFESGGRM
ncbi:hypothetical protein BKA64DRAFT_717607 [Cadophora sp. MPI-SDFR-AT-0126]|nr:hypothetical protein BKA64DRAFT_717607 [Leotiomycetes sp. MPI-SDFR-AT-0126]